MNLILHFEDFHCWVGIEVRFLKDGHKRMTFGSIEFPRSLIINTDQHFQPFLSWRWRNVVIGQNFKR